MKFKILEKSTPIRSGLRERRRPESPVLKGPSVTECWVPEEDLELWEIRQFGEKVNFTFFTFKTKIIYLSFLLCFIIMFSLCFHFLYFMFKTVRGL